MFAKRRAAREHQIERDNYYMGIAWAVRAGANCWGTEVGAALVRSDRVISTGYNGTPSRAKNCVDGGCIRCEDSKLAKLGRVAEQRDKRHTTGRALDRCICVHAEENAVLTAARFGIAVADATLYTTSEPCSSCLRKAIQVEVARVVYVEPYDQFPECGDPELADRELKQQSQNLVAQLRRGEATNFETLVSRPAPERPIEPPVRRAA